MRITRRPRIVPPFWRTVTPQGLQNYRQKRDWRLVLHACNVPHLLVRSAGQEYIYVPPLLEQRALAEIAGYEAEPSRPLRAELPCLLHRHPGLVVFFLLPLLVWHAMRSGWCPVPAFLPSPAGWEQAGILDSVLVDVYGQYYRLVTALTLHMDDAHLWGNIGFSALFLTALARLTGVGRAVWLTVLGGAAGNALALLLRKGPVLSLGFSTALFACVGLLSGLMASRESQRRRAVLPMAAGAALLALLGTEGPQTDYAAHVGGLLSGLALGFAEGLRQNRNWPAMPQVLCGLCALLLPLLCWLRAFA